MDNLLRFPGKGRTDPVDLLEAVIREFGGGIQFALVVVVDRDGAVHEFATEANEVFLSMASAHVQLLCFQAITGDIEDV